MTLDDLKKDTPQFSAKPHPEKIKIFAWYLHTQCNKKSFQGADVKRCYEELHYAPPASFGGYLRNLENAGQVIRSGAGFKLAAGVRDELTASYSTDLQKTELKELLLGLPNQVPNLAERTYLDEALICYANGALRACIVMTWNLAYHHLCDFILRSRLVDFNSRWLISFPGHHKRGNKQIASMDEFNAELKESEVIAISRDAGIVTKDVARILDEKLGKRNSAAHPSSVLIGTLQVDAFVDDLVRNVVLKLI